jgi:hypothetical protein
MTMHNPVLFDVSLSHIQKWTILEFFSFHIKKIEVSDKL